MFRDRLTSRSGQSGSSRRHVESWASSRSSFLVLAMRTSSQRQSMQLSLRTFVSRAFDAAARQRHVVQGRALRRLWRPKSALISVEVQNLPARRMFLLFTMHTFKVSLCITERARDLKQAQVAHNPYALRTPTNTSSGGPALLSNLGASTYAPAAELAFWR